MSKDKKIKVAILMGSESDLDTVQVAVDVLKIMKVEHEIRVLSAHRTPKDVVKYVEALPARGAQVIIAAAGMSAALAGTVAAHTILPVIGIPIETKTLKGLDSLLSTVQMPKGIPVACMAIGKSGAENSAIFACQILALQDETLRKKMLNFKEDMARAIRKIKI
ncbi:MAG: 5-(carboxyamino)imidazole ribonucleotide mutase [Candidatus Omnitrophica bacterium]|nr:5-(carboxyamino)imidazole ribonucleotide mutase [Candidatus Omnitrophota bacterium]